MSVGWLKVRRSGHIDFPLFQDFYSLYMGLSQLVQFLVYICGTSILGLFDG